MEAEQSLLCSQKPVSGPHPEPNDISLQLSNPFFKDTFSYDPPKLACFFPVASSLQIFWPKLC